MLVRRPAALRDHPFPSLAPRALPRLRFVEQLDAPHGFGKRKIFQQRAPLFERQRRDQAPVEPQNVEHVIAAAAVPLDLAVEDHVVYGKIRDCARDRR